jgi:anti-sigma factor RsiW
MDHDLLSAYLDGELDGAGLAQVEAQLTESTPEAAAWRAELEEVRGARELLRAVAARDAPDGFWDGVLAGVATADGTDAEVAPVVSLDERRRGPGRWIATAFAAAAAVALAVIIVPQRDSVSPDVTAVVVQHGAQASNQGDPVSTITPVGPLAGIRR